MSRCCSCGAAIAGNLPGEHAEHVQRSDGEGASAVSAGKVPCLEMVVRVGGGAWFKDRCQAASACVRLYVPNELVWAATMMALVLEMVCVGLRVFVCV